jgi:hypothetical protein
MSKAYFNETQRFRQPWIWLIVAITILAWGYAVISSLFESQAADKPAPDLVLIFVSIIPITLVILIIKLRLETRIRPDGIYFQFKPLQFKEKHIPPEAINSYEVREYKPIAEYGGWGIRAGGKKSGKAYNVSGNLGLQLYLKDGKKLLIGTQKPAEIRKAMEDLFGLGRGA